MSAAVEAAQKQLDNISVEQLEAALSSVNLAQPHQDMAPHSRPQSKKTSSVYDSGSSSARQERKPMYLCEPFCKRALVQGKLKNICVCPPGVERDEWIAVNRKFQSQLRPLFVVGPSDTGFRGMKKTTFIFHSHRLLGAAEQRLLRRLCCLRMPVYERGTEVSGQTLTQLQRVRGYILMPNLSACRLASICSGAIKENVPLLRTVVSERPRLDDSCFPGGAAVDADIEVVQQTPRSLGCRP